MRAVTEPINYLLDRFFTVTGALLFMQIPEFILQFQQRLGGHVDELLFQVIQLTEIAEKSGKTLQQYIEKFRISGDADFMAQAEFMQKLLDRYDTLASLQKDLEYSGIPMKIWLVLSSGESFMIEQTLNAFTPGLPLSTEGILLGIIGLAVGGLLWVISKSLVKRVPGLKKLAQE